MTMESLPPNDPNDSRRNGGGCGEGQPNPGNSAPIDVMGDMRDAPAVVAIFLLGVAAWFLRERCVC